MKGYNFKQVIEKSPNLSLTSKRQYIYNINLLLSKLQAPEANIDWVLRHPKETNAFVISTYGELQTRKALIVAVSSLFKHDPTLQCTLGSDLLNQWNKITTDVNIAVSSRYNEGRATPRQEHSHIPWEDIMTRLGDLARTEYASQRHLLLAMYTLEPPKRLDYGNLRIYTPSTFPSSPPKTHNYLSIAKGKQAVLVLNLYKTAKAYDTKKFTLSKELTDIIYTNLLANPRGYLFQDRKLKPYTDVAFAKYTARTLSTIFDNKPVTVNTLRHSIIRYYLGKGITHNERMRLSERMCHSVSMQSAYQFKMEGEEDILPPSF